jgi:hypothetical protein
MKHKVQAYPFEKLPDGDMKMYLASFRKKESNQSDFYKIGITSYKDALDRFKYEPEQYRNWNIYIVKTVWGPKEEIEVWEKEYQKRYPKTFWIEEKIGGVTEIFRAPKQEIDKIITEFTLLGNKYYYARELKRQKLRRDYDLNGVLSEDIT